MNYVQYESCSICNMFNIRNVLAMLEIAGNVYELFFFFFFKNVRLWVFSLRIWTDWWLCWPLQPNRKHLEPTDISHQEDPALFHHERAQHDVPGGCDPHQESNMKLRFRYLDELYSIFAEPSLAF